MTAPTIDPGRLAALRAERDAARAATEADAQAREIRLAAVYHVGSQVAANHLTYSDTCYFSHETDPRLSAVMNTWLPKFGQPQLQCPTADDIQAFRRAFCDVLRVINAG